MAFEGETLPTSIPGPLTLGSGDSPYLFQANAGTMLNVLGGSAGSPLTAQNPLVKIAQTVAKARVTGNIGEIEAALTVISKAVTPNAIQVTAGAFIAINESSTVDTFNDVAAGYFFGQMGATPGVVNGNEASFHAARLLGGPTSQLASITSIVGAAGTVTVTTATAHGLTTAQPVLISGTTAFNGTYVVTVVNATSYTFSSATVATEAAGTSQGMHYKTITSIVGSGTTATVTAVAHGYSTRNIVRILGTADFNGTYSITKVDADTFTFASAVAATDNSGVASGITAFLASVEVQGQNRTGIDDVYNPVGYTHSYGLDVSSNGSNVMGVGILLARGNTAMDVGIGIPAFTAGSPVVTDSFRDDGSALRSIHILGTHASGAVVIEAGSGMILVGRATPVGSSSVLEAYGADSAAHNPLVRMGIVIGSQAQVVQLVNQSGVGTWEASAGASSLAGTTAGDTILRNITVGQMLHLAGTAVAYSVGQNGQHSWFGAALSGKLAVTGSRGGNAALASLLTQLATYGLLTDSSSA